ncbi:MAG: hypothetical protein PF447_02830 [Spirochaetaceae bacterium]|jgi:hypothetical protein|nr:hypothetical protein [Spirochaetaceae bacterium]
MRKILGYYILSLCLTGLMAEDFRLIINTQMDSEALHFFLGDIYPNYSWGVRRRSPVDSGYWEAYVPPQAIPSESLPELGSQRSFYYDDINGQILRVHAQLVYAMEQGNCLIYVQKSGAMNNYDWNSLGSWFEQEIFTTVSQAFGKPGDVDGNDRVILLFFKFPDHTMVGFFSDTDLYGRSVYSASNQGEILYFNLSEGDPFSSLMKETYPHELQHLINASQRWNRSLENMELWIDEGMAENAAYILLQQVSPFHISQWKDEDSEFWDGLSMNQWNSSLEGYAWAFLFMRYVAHQAGTEQIYGDIILQPRGNSRSILLALREYGVDFDSFGDLLQAFYLALLFQEEQGIYSLGIDPGELQLQPRSPGSEFQGLLPTASAVYLPLKSPMTTTEYPESLRIIDTRDYR